MISFKNYQGHTIEAHGIKGMKRTPWRKTFKHSNHLNDWADKNDADVHGTRDLERAKKGNLSPAMKEEIQPSKGVPVPAKEFARGVLKDLKKVNVKEDLSADEQFDLIESVITELAFINNVDSEILWEQLESLTDEELLEYAIDAKGHKSSTGGLTQKGVDYYRNKTPGSKLQTAVTTPPSKLKAGSKAANRRKSFCARMGGVDGPMKDEKGRPTRKALALRKWNC